MTRAQRVFLIASVKDLPSIIDSNEHAARQRTAKPNHLNRESSCCFAARGLVLYSATLRSTVFIDAKHEKVIADFLTAWKQARSVTAKNQLVDSFF